MDSKQIAVIGSGLAGSQAALTVANLGGRVELHEMRPLVNTPAHRTKMAAELVCSNSLRSNHAYSAPWLLKEELRHLHCDLLSCAEQSAIPGGSSLTVDRDAFSTHVTKALDEHPNIRRNCGEVCELDPETITIVATGPLTSAALADSIQALTGRENLSFYDAINPVVDAETVSMEKVFAASRYDKGGRDFLNCPMDRAEYVRFRDALVQAEGVFAHDWDEVKLFGCPPLEALARSGEDTLRFSVMKPVGLVDPRTGRQAHAIVQLRQENLRCDSYNLVGFQNQLKFGEQERIFRMIPGLERAEFVRFGQMHRNTYLLAPVLLNTSLNLIKYPNVFFAGQLCGVEGYVEAMATGLIAGLNAWRRSSSLPPVEFPRASALGSLLFYLSQADPEDFAPARFTFDLLPPVDQGEAGKVHGRQQRRTAQCQNALRAIEEVSARDIALPAAVGD